MDDDAADIVYTIICWIVLIGGYVLFKYLMYKFWLWSFHKKYNIGGLHDKNTMTWKKASKVFGIRAVKLRKMPKTEIKKVYRMKAKKVHPDHGGSNEKFNTLNEAYQFAYAA